MGKIVMGHQAQELGSRHLDTRFFSVVGPSYIFDDSDELRSTAAWTPQRQPLGGAQRWLLLGVLAALIVAVFSIGTIQAGPRKAHVAPFSTLAGGATSFPFAGGTEVARW
jgi:hypothetical protein